MNLLRRLTAFTRPALAIGVMIVLAESPDACAPEDPPPSNALGECALANEVVARRLAGLLGEQVAQSFDREMCVLGLLRLWLKIRNRLSAENGSSP